MYLQKKKDKVYVELALYSTVLYRGVRGKIEVVRPCIGFCDHTAREARHLGGGMGACPPRKIFDIRGS